MGTIARRSGFLERNGERLYYEANGEGPPLVLCHGAGGNHAVWYQQVSHFARARQVVTWDHRGFGRSSDADARSGPGVAVEDLRALLDHLELGAVGPDDVHLMRPDHAVDDWVVLRLGDAPRPRLGQVGLRRYVPGKLDGVEIGLDLKNVLPGRVLVLFEFFKFPERLAKLQFKLIDTFPRRTAKGV